MIKISKVIEDHLLVNYSKEQSSHSSKERKFYISDMGKCPRMRWVKRKGVTAEFSIYVYWLFKIGDLYHDYGYEALETAGRLLESEDYVSDEHFVGRYDGIITNEIDSKDVMDIKSIGGYKFLKAMKGDIDKGSIAQVLTYLMFLKDAGRKDLKRGTLVFMNKEPSGRVPHIVYEKSFYLTKWREEKLRKEMASLANYWETDEIPPCNCPSWYKDYNSFLPFCTMSDGKVRKVLKYLEVGKEIITSKKELILVNPKINKRKVIDLKNI